MENTDGYIDLSTIPTTHTTLCVQVDFSTSDPTVTPQFCGWTAVYKTVEVPSFTFDVRVQNDTLVSTIDNSVNISTTTPEIREDNNDDTDRLFIEQADLVMNKSVDFGALNFVSDGNVITYTLSYENQ